MRAGRCGSNWERYWKAELRRWRGCILAMELAGKAQSVAVSGRGLALGGGAEVCGCVQGTGTSLEGGAEAWGGAEKQG